MNRFNKPAFNRISTASQRRKTAKDEARLSKQRRIPSTITFVDEFFLSTEDIEMVTMSLLGERSHKAHSWVERGSYSTPKGAHILFWDGETK